MQILIFILLLCSFSISANVFEEISCGVYDASKYPNKTHFKGSTHREISEIDVKEFFDELGEAGSPQRGIFKLVDRVTGKYKRSFPRESPNSENDIAIEQQIIQPEIILNLGTKIITGSNNGEFGGELLLIDEKNKITLLKIMNVEDIHEMPFGLVVTSGLAHLSRNYGDIHLIDSNFEIKKLYSLVGMPKSSWLLENGNLLINSGTSGAQVLTKSGFMKRVQCVSNKPMRAI
ncbi:hypothetical protein [Pseudoalteromonas fuliginea]|uniref:Phosphodiester glycosidase domain-containing protein n=1 Tax=Pseudoalteromonas fuliginea TaxID=1872678 RepID=A0ABQ6RGU8_9GAMM|nr:hypothetical protein [Pseudoalteromonas fuliginea]KAA1154262.1 hypothetical protein EU509_12110 [Pseudoalteromonas fuliginea]KAA1166862.1 hypothetical protein EUZ79_12100 [Pseudoalteromonas fuliginea]